MILSHLTVYSMPNRKKQVYRFLNNVQFTNAYIESVIDYINDDVIPPGMNARQQATFIDRFDQDWEVIDDELIFTPLNLTAVSEELAQDVLQLLYDDPVNSLGKGINSFYDTVRSMFVGITRHMVEEFLKRQEVYLLHRVCKVNHYAYAVKRVCIVGETCLHTR
jgi:hypothetical protein